MPAFECTICGAQFELAEDILARFPGWKPRYCRDHRDGKRSADGERTASGAPRGSLSHPVRLQTGPLPIAKPGGRKGRNFSHSGPQSTADVLATHHGGPDSGIFTDGSCEPNPGPGGWGMVHVRDGQIVSERCGHDPDTTNNRMEMTAIISALESLAEDSDETIWTDSDLCVKTLTVWAAGWEQRGWKRKAGPIANLDLVQHAWAMVQQRPRVSLRWLKAHAGSRWNEYADALASAWSRADK